MLILKEKEIYLIDRDNNVFAAPQFHFPQRKLPKEHVYDTLLDGVSPNIHLKGLCHLMRMRALIRSILKSLAQLFQIPSESSESCFHLFELRSSSES